MKCEDVQVQLSVWANEKHSKRQQNQIAAHVAGCASCQAFRNSVQRLEKTAEGWRADTPLLKAPIRHRAPRYPRYVALAAAASLVIGFVLFSARSTPAYAELQKVESALQHATSVHLVLRWRTGVHQDGELKQQIEMWYSNGRWRKISEPDSGGDRIILTTPGGPKFYRYMASRGGVVEMIEDAPQQTSFAMKDLAPNLLPAQAKTIQRPLGQERGKDVFEVATVDGSERVVFWLNQGTDLPSHIEKQIFEKGAWKITGTVDLDFGIPIPDSKFDPRALSDGKK